MVLKHIAKKAAQKPPQIRPNWVSDTNASCRAWEYILSQKDVKADYIRRHGKSGDFSRKQNYQISGSDVARALKMQRSTLMNTSTYSEPLATFLNSINRELEQLKTERVKQASVSRSRGPTEQSKKTLVNINKALRQRIADLEQEKTADLVTKAFDRLPLPIRRKLGLT